MENRNILKDFLHSFFKDVRQHVVEEGWFGKKVTDQFRDGDMSRPTSRNVTETTLLHRTSITESSRQSYSTPDRGDAAARLDAWFFGNGAERRAPNDLGWVRGDHAKPDRDPNRSDERSQDRGHDLDR